MSEQKKMRINPRKQPFHSTSQSNSLQHARYGPPTLKKMKISKILGQNTSLHSMGLKRYLRCERQVISDDTKQSYFDLALRTGGLNYFKRFRSLRYLQAFSSKKNTFNLCQEQTLSKLYHQKENLKRQACLFKTKKKSQIRF